MIIDIMSRKISAFSAILKNSVMRPKSNRRAIGEPPSGLVAQVSNLLYRRLPVGRPYLLGRVCRLEIRDIPAGREKSALRPPVGETLYHSLATSSFFEENFACGFAQTRQAKRS
jgi:hypothetical protein